jgi:tRNA(fMet)-specific endonuclease VapC
VAGLLFLDTSVLLAAERANLPVEAIARPDPDARLAMSVITVAELLQGLHRARTDQQRQSRESFINHMLARLELFAVDLAVARQHARIWAGLAERGEIIGPYDLIIAATAVAYSSPLATLNFGEFQKIEGLEVLALIPTPAPRRRRGRSREGK